MDGKRSVNGVRVGIELKAQRFVYKWLMIIFQVGDVSFSNLDFAKAGGSTKFIYIWQNSRSW